MANTRREPVSYRPFRAQPLLADGLLPVERAGGELLDKASGAMFRLASEFGAIADRQKQERDRKADAAGRRDVRADIIADMPQGDIGGNGAARGSRFSADVSTAIDQAATKYGVSPVTLRTIAQMESGGNPRAQNPSSSAGGLFQFVDSTAKQYGLVDRFDPAQSADAAARLTRDNAAYLRKVLGRDPTPGELYLAHQQGAGGAAKLLRNPDASAASVVGEKAVRLNGGQPGMTAGQFAKLWTSKAEGGYVLPSDPSQISGASGKSLSGGPVLRGGKWRPKGEDTVYGRAYDEEGARLYLQTLDLEIRKTTAQAFDLYKDDPRRLAAVLADLKASQLREHVFDEIRPEYELTFEKEAQGYIRQSVLYSQQKAEQERIGELNNRTVELSTDVARKVEAFDPNDPNTVAALESSQRALDDHFDSAAAQGLITRSAADKAKAASRNDTAGRFYLKQAEDLDADGVKAMREKMSEDFAAGGLDGLDTEGWTALKANLAGVESRKRGEDAKAVDDLSRRGTAFVQRVEQGFEVAPADMTQFMLDTKTAAKGDDIAQATKQMMDSARIIREAPIAEARTYVSGLREKLGKNPSDTEIAAVTYAEQRLATVEKAIATDPVGYAIGSGTVKLEPIDTTDSQALEASLAKRRDQMEEVSRRYGGSTTVFRPGERAMLAQAMVDNPDVFPDFALAVRNVFGDKAGAALAEIGEEAPALAHASGLTLATGDDSVAREVAMALSARKQGTFKVKMPEQDKLARVGGAAIGSALQLRSGTKAAALDVANLLFERAANLYGFDPSEVAEEGTPANAAFLRALDRSLGGAVVNGEKTGGIGEVNGAPIVVPAGMPVDRPQELMRSLSDADLALFPPIATANDIPISASRIRFGHLVSVGDGIYRVALGDPEGFDPEFIMSDHGFWEIDLKKIEARRLQQPERRPLWGWQTPDMIQ